MTPAPAARGQSSTQTKVAGGLSGAADGLLPLQGFPFLLACVAELAASRSPRSTPGPVCE